MNKRYGVFFVAVMLAGCTPYIDGLEYVPAPVAVPVPAATPPPPIVAEQAVAVAGGEIAVAMRLPQTLNPLLNNDGSVGLVLGLMFEPLAVINDRLFPAPNPNLTQSIEFSADGLTVFLTLNNAARWSDGRAVTAADIVFSVNFLKDAPAGSLYSHMVEDILGVYIVNNQTVRISLSAPTGGAAYFLCFPVIPQHHFNHADMFNPAALRNNEPVGNGPFMFDYRHYARHIGLARNGYAANPPYIDRITVFFTPDYESDVNSFTQNVIQAHFAPFYDRRAYREHAHTQAREVHSHNFEFIGFNRYKPLFQERAVRQAIAHSLPMDEVQRDAYALSLFSAPAFVSERSWLYEPDAAVPFDLDAARQLLLSSRFSPYEYFYGVRILVNSGNCERLAVARILERTLTETGFFVTIEEEPFEIYVQRLNNNDFDLFIGGFSFDAGFDFALALQTLRHTGELTDQKLNAVAEARTQADYLAAMSDFQKHITEELPLIGLGFTSAALLVRSHIQGAEVPPQTHIFSGAGGWWLR